MSHQIQHSGVIEKVEDGCVHVRIVQTSACAACKVAGYCNAAESKEKIVDVYTSDALQMKEGDVVTVTASGGVAVRALMWGFALPLLLLLGVLMAVLVLTANDGLAALCGLAVLLPYYAVLYLLRDKLREQLAFAIEKH